MGIEELANIIDESDNQPPSFEKMPAKRPPLLPKNLTLADIADLPSQVNARNDCGSRISPDANSKVIKSTTLRQTPPTVMLEDGQIVSVPWKDANHYKELKASAKRARRGTQRKNI